MPARLRVTVNWNGAERPDGGHRRLLSGAMLCALAVAALLTLPAFAMLSLAEPDGVVRRPQPSATPTVTPTPIPVLPESFIAPYAEEYWVTQGLHGGVIGHMAIDLAAGEGALIRSPIVGQVTANYLDRFGNSVLVIENEVYLVTLMHGFFTIPAGTFVNQGDVVGEEGNVGFTKDMAGHVCSARFCGYHTHLNVFDKRVGANVNPWALLLAGPIKPPAEEFKAGPAVPYGP